MLKKLLTLLFSISFVADMAHAQSAPEHHVWQDKRSFVPSSGTARAITGAIKLSGNPKFATTGQTMTIQFGHGKPLVLKSVGGFWREWLIGDSKKVTAEVYSLTTDPGTLLNGNRLCGDPKSNPATFVVFYEYPVLNLPPELGMAVFGSKQAPADINSSGLCGTFGYSTD